MTLKTSGDDDIFSKIKQIKQSEKDVVYGYIRNAENDYKLITNNIPELIFFICLMYYYELDIFETYSEKLQISGSRNSIIEKIKYDKYNKWATWKCSAYGTLWIPSNTNQTFIWTVKYIKGASTTNIGIVNNNHHFDINENFNKKKSYVFVLNGQVYIDQTYRPSFVTDLRCKIGDKLKFIVDFETSTIKIDKNDGEKTKTIINDIKKSPHIKYKFAVAMFTKGNCIEILNA